jgi:hypothetical protein
MGGLQKLSKKILKTAKIPPFVTANGVFFLAFSCFM